MPLYNLQRSHVVHTRSNLACVLSLDVSCNLCVGTRCDWGKRVYQVLPNAWAVASILPRAHYGPRGVRSPTDWLPWTTLMHGTVERITSPISDLPRTTDLRLITLFKTHQLPWPARFTKNSPRGYQWLTSSQTDDRPDHL